MRFILQTCCFISMLSTVNVNASVAELNANELSLPAINDFTQDPSNAFWLATNKGLFNYDSVHLFSGQAPPFSSFANQAILQVATYKSWLLINTEQGLSLINLINNQLIQLTATPLKQPILTTELGFYFLYQGQIHTIKDEKLHSPFAFSEQIVELALGFNNSLWLHSGSNLVSHFDLASNAITAQLIVPAPIAQLSPSQTSAAILINTNNDQHYLFNNTHSMQEIKLQHAHVQQLNYFDDQLYYLHKNRAYKHDLTTKNTNPLFYSAPARFLSIKQNNQQLWLQTATKSWLKLPAMQIITTPITDNPAPRMQQYFDMLEQLGNFTQHKKIITIAYLREDKWAVATDTGLYLYSARNLTFDLLIKDQVAALHSTAPTTLWVATKKQLIKYDFATQQQSQTLPISNINALTSLNDEQYLASDGEQLFYIAKQQLTALELETEALGQINAMYYQRNSSRLWLATSNGLWQSQWQAPENSQQITLEINFDKVSTFNTTAIYEAPQNALWIVDSQAIKLYKPSTNLWVENATHSIAAYIDDSISYEQLPKSLFSVSYRDKIMLFAPTGNTLLEVHSTQVPPQNSSFLISHLTLHYQEQDQDYYHLATNAVNTSQPLKGISVWFSSNGLLPMQLNYRLDPNGDWLALPNAQTMLSLASNAKNIYLEVKNLNQVNNEPLVLMIKQTAFAFPHWINHLVLAAIFAILLLLIVYRLKSGAKHNLVNALMTQSKDAIWIANEQFQITNINQAFTTICGFTLADVVGKKPKAFTVNGRDKKLESLIYNDLEVDGYWSGEIWNVRKDGQPYALDLSITKVKTPNLRTSSAHYIGLFSDVTARKNNERAMLKLTTRDSVTGLSNRTIFIESVNKAIASCNNNFPNLLIIFIDLDNFNKINESLGHAIGDELLKEVAGRLTRNLDSGYTLARLGGDEFAILVPPYLYSGMSVFFAKKLADNILKQFQTPFMLEGIESFISACCGIAGYPENGYNSEALMRSANSALNHAKKMGHNNYQFFDKSKHTIDMNELSKESALFRAIEHQDFQLFYQVKYNADKDQIHGFEALVRWPQVDGSIISPAEFIPLAEQNGAIIPLTLLLMKQLFKQLELWRNEGVSFGKVAINISALHFQQSSLVETLTECLTNYDVPARCVELEITESAMMDNPEFAQQQMNRLKALGFTIALDDFGTGHSSLGYLKRFPIDTLKIDRSFIKDIVDSEQDRNITATIIRLAKYLHIDVVAEGVETKEQAYMLHVMGCNTMQGYYYSRPLCAEKVATYLEKNNLRKQSNLMND
ncbi:MULTISPECIES: EAL domain-containing protein [unclassified Pseudoalteromonas]|uniref:EAL domain-containing protein n=1 Tax=unclassified Pseudoalteromonas TaxID=194690 RepID=UPI0016009F30|nr:EAL domain-containing protein [Pseudoalteromonas sp. SG41-2]MBB1478516.1 EAL domain-containing protein [Pseudoalteromonas sp. SG41-2]